MLTPPWEFAIRETREVSGIPSYLPETYGGTCLSVLDPFNVPAGPRDRAVYTWLRASFEKLRYQVFATECGFEPQNDRGSETDTMDSVSPYLVEWNACTVITGCRLLLKERVGRLPIERYTTGGTFHPHSIEISRMVTVAERCSGAFYWLLSYSLPRVAEVYGSVREAYWYALRARGLRRFRVLSGERMIKKDTTGGTTIFVPLELSVEEMRDVFSIC